VGSRRTSKLAISGKPEEEGVSFHRADWFGQNINSLKRKRSEQATFASFTFAVLEDRFF